MQIPPYKVALIDDEKEIRDLLVNEFQERGVEVVGLESGESLLRAIDSINPSIILLDSVMPGKSGLEILAHIRSHPVFCEVPIMIVSAVDDLNDKIQAFEIGADDYITKPFSVMEILARTQALVRRAMGLHRNHQKKLGYGSLVLDVLAHRVFHGLLEIKLTLTEFKILYALMKQVGVVLSRDRLREEALGNMNVSDRTIDVHMAALRRKLDDLGNHIETVRGVGYRLNNSAQPSSNPQSNFNQPSSNPQP